MKNELNNCNAFTLAEVLITLGIIGVVVAITLPTLNTRIRNQELETEFKKAQSTLAQLNDYLVLDNGEFDESTFNRTRSFKATFEKRLKGTSCTQFAGMNCIDMSLNMSHYKTMTGNSAYERWFDDGQFTTSDGMLYMLNNSADIPLTVSVDINGQNKKPNRWGQDLFTFQFVKGKIIPMGDESSEYPYETNPDKCNLASDDMLNGISCATRAVSEKDYFKNLR